MGLYVTSFYLGGAVGASLGGLAWTFGGWEACVASAVVMLTVMGIIVLTAWERAPRSNPPSPVEPV